MKKNKVIITGANGFLGSSLVNFLSKEFEVIPYTRKDNIDNIPKLKPDYIIHCAAEIYNKDLMFESNIILTYKLLEIAKNLSLKNFIYIGSSSEYGRKIKPISEEDILKPDTMYEGTKSCGTLLTRVYGKTYQFMTSIVRPFSLYGINEPNRKFIPYLYNVFSNNLSINIKNGVHDWIYIDDFIEGIKKVMLQNNSIGEIFHFGTGIQHTNLEVFNIFSEIFNKKIKYSLVDNISTSAGIDSECWVADISKANKILNWYPTYNLKKGIQKYINYQKP